MLPTGGDEAVGTLKRGLCWLLVMMTFRVPVAVIQLKQRIVLAEGDLFSIPQFIFSGHVVFDKMPHPGLKYQEGEQNEESLFHP